MAGELPAENGELEPPVGELVSASAEPKMLAEPVVSEPPGEQVDEAKRNTLKLLALGAVATLEATSLSGIIYWLARGDQTPAGRLLTKRDQFIEKLHGQPSVEDIVRQVYAIPGVQPYVDLAYERQLAHITDGTIGLDWLNRGNSYTYLLGVMDDDGGLFHQPEAVSSVSMSGLNATARARLGLDETNVAASAQIGAYSGRRPKGDKDPAPDYGFLSEKQLGGTAVQDFLRYGRALKIDRCDLELDDLRLMIATSAELVSSLDDLTALLTDENLEASAEAHLEALEAMVPEVAWGAGDNYESAADIIGPRSRARIAEGLARIILMPVICWSLKNQEVIPGSPYGKPTKAALKYLKPDPTGPDRYFIYASEIPYGHEIAYWIWVEMMLARIRALRNISLKYGPALGIVPENLSKANDDPDFYRSQLLGRNGNGHQGPKGMVDVAHIELDTVRNQTPNGIIIANSLADIALPKAA